MFRVYYLVNSMDQVKTALKNIEQSEIGTNRVHVMARDNGELSREGIHATTPWEDTNIMTTGFYGAVVGAVGYLVCAECSVRNTIQETRCPAGVQRATRACTYSAGRPNAARGPGIRGRNSRR